MCGETLSDAVTVKRRNGPRRLRANDDDDDCPCVNIYPRRDFRSSRAADVLENWCMKPRSNNANSRSRLIRT